MRRAGSVVGAAQGVAVVRAESEQFPDTGTALVDEDLDDIGTVVDVFGPIERPYLAVATEHRLAPLVGNTLYARE